MKCLNPNCNSNMADELNVSINVSETAVTANREYTGTTEYGDTLVRLGTTCVTCSTNTYVHDWKDQLVEHLGPQQLDLVLDEPRWCWACKEGDGIESHADYTEKWASKWDASALMCKEHALAYALSGQQIVLWEEVED